MKKLRSSRLPRLLLTRFASTGKLPGRGLWSSLPASERAAWELLGWNEHKWEGRDSMPPLTSLSNWRHLDSSQKAAARHGLGWEEKTWDSSMAGAVTTVDDDHDNYDDNYDDDAPAVRPSSSPSSPPESSSSSLASSIAGSAWSMAKVAAPFVGSALVAAGGRGRRGGGGLGLAVVGGLLQNLPAAIEFGQGPVPVVGVETCCYLDDSGSMTSWQGSRTPWNASSFGFSSSSSGRPLDEAHRVLESLEPHLRGPTRVVKFGSAPTVLAPRDTGGLTAAGSTAATLAWDGSSGSTYMWDMILNDVRARYVPEGGKLRLVVVTDGQDTDSPGAYQGIRGMDPLMHDLQAEGYDIEWHIVVVGRVPERQRYASLAAATGGTFLSIGDGQPFDPAARDARRFFQAIDRGGGDTDARREREEREQRQRQYELEAKQGKQEKFGWYKALPPPSKNNRKKKN